MMIIDGQTQPGERVTGCWMGHASGWSIFGRYEAIAQEIRLFDPPTDWQHCTTERQSPDVLAKL
jgi:hypothetical protein